jgi:hypothetical protein
VDRPAEQNDLAIRIDEADGGRIAGPIYAGSAVKIAAGEVNLIPRDGNRATHA